MITYRGYFGSSATRRQGLIPRRDSYRDVYIDPNQSQRVEYQLFSSDYFSGADVKIYFGDIWIDDITKLEFSLQENVMPIYGYSSYTYDAIARGQRIIQGMFSINFTSVGYMQQVLENANAIMYAIQEGKRNEIIPPKYYETMKLDEILELLGKESFDQIADEYERAIWGEDRAKLDLLNDDMHPYFSQDDLGFDIRIQYGAVMESTGYLSESFYLKQKEESPNVTVDVINGVQLTGMMKNGISTDAQGAPIQESYTFIARDINGTSFERLFRKKNGITNNFNVDNHIYLGTVYRKMQYGPIR